MLERWIRWKKLAGTTGTGPPRSAVAGRCLAGAGYQRTQSVQAASGGLVSWRSVGGDHDFMLNSRNSAKAYPSQPRCLYPHPSGPSGSPRRAGPIGSDQGL